ncbi:non-ribosomal peptide synthetase [Streptomyces mirabilis]|uniref:Amino acid adenylation domain-containing protein n=2 Tax=Streptomyces TaxID=1883 RepID=A0ABU3V5B9_9ACTN|nr:non-ribosomal peptide synthetase [Streptomyces mirabilis]MCX5355724.1 amino acid adenylation domain-containing protein [Streptomyces mirabilis]MDU9001367.1 amino acid adenylation domain-containing protein [Streptomyces mirabilis]
MDDRFSAGEAADMAGPAHSAAGDARPRRAAVQAAAPHGPTPSLLADAVLARARRYPAAPAVVDGAAVFDYARLDRASARVAARLRANGVGAGQSVAVCLPRSWRLVCVMLGIRRAGATVVPLDRLSPPERRRHIIEDSAAVAVVHDVADSLDLPGNLTALDASLLIADEDGAAPEPGGPEPADATGAAGGTAADGTPAGRTADSWTPGADGAGRSGRAPGEPHVPQDAPRAGAATAAFVFYTSGTTGRPKGVEVTDEGVLRLARPGRLTPRPGDRYACLSNPAFDALSFEVWTPLLTGGTCVILGDREVQSPHALATALRDRAVDTLFITVSLFNAVVDEVPGCFAGARHVLIGGEQLGARVVRRWYQANPGTRTVLHNAYGPTEATTFALSYAIPRDFEGDAVPLGGPLPGTRCLLRTEDGGVAEPGEVAELLLSGPALALGYRNLPAETAERFVTLPGDGGEERWYRTGDLVRRDDDGRVTYVGRADRQVKVRGFRIEPGEVERLILTHPQVRRARVCTRREDADRHELLAFVVLGGRLSFEEYDRHLSAVLPAYMRPHHTHLVDDIPRNANGKVDDAALLGAASTPWRGERRTGLPVTAAQRALLEVAEEVLAVTGLRPDDRWIPSGGDSLRALRFRHEVLRRFGADLPTGLVLRADFARLAEAVRAADATGGDHPPLPAASPEATAPATSEQERLWLLHEREVEDRSYDVPLVFRVHGTVDPAALRRALHGLVERHPALRTRLVPTPRGLLQQVDAPYDPWQPCRAVEGEPWQTTADRFFTHRFLLRDSRMLRAAWVPSRAADACGPGGGLLLLHLHHVAVDGWSVNLLLRDLTDGYAAALAGDAPPGPGDRAVTPLDFARWQREWRASPAYLGHRSRLRDHYEAGGELSPALPAPETPVPRRAGLLRTSVDVVGRGALDRLAAERGQTRFHLLLSAFACSLYGVTGQTRPLVAAPVANRPRPEFAETVGMFANTVLLPLALDPDQPVGEHLARHAAQAGSVLEGQEIALADVLADHSFRAAGPLFDFMFVLENTDFSALGLPGCEVRPLWPRPLDAKCALTLSVVEHDAGFDCLWEYRDDFGADRVRAAARLFRQVLDRLTDGADATLRELVLPYRRGLPEPGRGRVSAPDFTTVAEGFARQVRRTPAAPAVTDGRTVLSYARLDAWAEATAAELRHRVPDDPAAPAALALYLEPSVEHIVALLAAARLNLTVVPLDPTYPPALLAHVLRQADPLCVLMTPESAEALDAVAPPGLPRHLLRCAGEPPRRPSSRPAAPPHRALRPLYTLFTSGSTGVPKGVQVPDETLCNLLTWQRAEGGLAAPAVTQQFSMLSFDVSFQEIFGTLCSGGLLRLVDPAWRHDVPALLDELESGRAERLFLPYVALQLLADHGVRTGRYPSRLREVVTAGEQLVCTDAIRRWFAHLPGARLFNHYGPTETHVVSGLCLEGDPAAWPLRPAIGRPVSGAVLRVVDDGGLPVPPGATGHLLIGGVMARRCYLGDAALNRSRFTDDPEAGTFYRSGDLARFDEQGLLHYAGREDAQVKLSGHRLELGQVEAALLQYPGVANAVAVVDDGVLVACLELRGEDPDPAGITRHLGGLLPRHVRVGRFRRLEALPRTPSGKLDRHAALTAGGRELLAGDEPGPARSPLEQRLTDLFREATGTSLAVAERFFDAGVTSLDLMRFQLRCSGQDGLAFRMPDLFEHVTIRALAGFLDRRATAEETDGARAATAPARPSSARTDAPRAIAGDRSPGRSRSAEEPVAVVGMAVRLPGARDLAAFWDLVVSGRRGIEHFAADEGRVGARSRLDGPLAFDPGRFGISPQDARLMDPQQRHLLSACVEALAHAGCADPSARRVGVVAACGENTYFQAMLREADPAALPDPFRLALHHEKDFLATKAAYHLGLTGPAFTVQSACSSSLVGVHLAAGLLRQGEADMMLAGGVLVDPGLSDGYTYRPQHIFSPDGHCRPFSADASGTVGASGVGVVVLKPLSAARRDGDTVYAVVTGSALSNDGAAKLSYSAPSVAGQRGALRAALDRAGRGGGEVGYVEAHGTGTRLGDPVEAAALRQAYGLADDAHLALSSVKSQLGHLGAAAGIVGLVRAVLAVHHGVIPPTVDFDRLNPEIDDGPFRVPTAAEPWPHDVPRVAAVSSFGIGGTNAHLLVEKPDGPQGAGAPPAPAAASCLPLSAASEAALRADARRIADYLSAHPQAYPRVLRHLQAGRPALAHRAAALCPDAGTAVAWLRSSFPVTAPGDGPRTTPDGTARPGPVEAWTTGDALVWPDGPASAPWDFPPPALNEADYDFERAVPAEPPAPDAPAGPPRRLPAGQWLHQPVWTRLRRARTEAPARGRTAVVVTGAGTDWAAWRVLERHYTRVVAVSAGAALVRHPDGHYEADPADIAHLTAVLADVTASGAGVDWLHALPLTIGGGIGEQALDSARWACLDTVAAFLQALADVADDIRPRLWLLSQQAQAVTGVIRRPEAALLAAATEVPRQELGLSTRWVDLPGTDPDAWAPFLAGLLLHETPAPAVLALREGFWWHRTLQPVPAPAESRVTGRGTHLILGGTGGIGRTVAAALLGDDPDSRVVLLSRQATMPASLARWSDRVTLVPADLATDELDLIAERLAPHLRDLTGIVHAAGAAAGALLVRRDARAARRATAAKLRGALLTERLIAAYRPDHVVYCSSMAAQFGGIGQFDYAAANGCLDAFAQYAPVAAAGDTVRTAVAWDAWRELGMAQDAAVQDARHRAHLAVALTPDEGAAVFRQALALQLPHLLVNTTPVTEARRFYEPLPGDSAAGPRRAGGTASGSRATSGTEGRDGPAGAVGRRAGSGDVAARLAEAVCDLLGVAQVDPAASLYDLGADSLALLELVDEVKRRYGTEIELSRLSHRVSLDEILGHLVTAGGAGHEAGASVDVEVWQHGTGPDVLCLVHPVGGDIQAYRPLVSALDDRLTVCLVADPALRDARTPAWSIAERAEHYLVAVRAAFPRAGRRLNLAGWSFGAWTALSMAAAAEESGPPVHRLYLLDPPPPGAGPLAAAYDDRQVDAVFARELGGNRAGDLGERGRDYAARLARCCRANLAAMAVHRLPRLARTPATVWLAERPVADVTALVPQPGPAGEWTSHLPAPLRIHRVDADHYGLVAPPHTAAIAAVVAADLAGAAADGPPVPVSVLPDRH